ncbi:MAG: ABC transporter transmembrane domain-containing protein [Pseudomonadota bacterium]
MSLYSSISASRQTGQPASRGKGSGAQHTSPSGRTKIDREAARRTLSALLPFLKPYKSRIVVALIALIGATLATLAVPIAVRAMIDDGFAASDGVPLTGVFAALIAVVAVLAFTSALRYYQVTWLGERVIADLRAAAFSRIIRFDQAYHDASRSGELVSRLTTDATQMKLAIGSSISVAMRNFLLFVGASIMMVVTSPTLSGAVLIAIPIIILPIIFFGRRVRERSRLAQDVVADASALATEAIGSVRTVQAHGAELRLSDRFKGAADDAFSAARQSFVARALLTGFAIFVIFASVILVLWFGAAAVVNGTMTAGELGQFVLYAVFAAGALGEVSQVTGEVAQAIGAADRLCGLLQVPISVLQDDEDRSGEAPLDLTKGGGLAFQEVHFSYGHDHDRANVLEGASFSVEPGQTLAIVGPSGSGKSTILHLLMRFYLPRRGRIEIGGVDINALDPRGLRAQMALVPQEVSIFASPIRDNVAFARPDASDKQVRAALDAANALDFVEALPHGLDTIVGERGITLSGGQRQRLAIARAVLQDAPILLLDEATSALDSESEHLIQEALEGLMRGRTVLAIAHRLSTVRRADEILVLDHGKVVERGSHEQLASAGGLYSRLAELQFVTTP